MIANAQFNYPAAKKTDLYEEYHGVKVEDPYRLLEDDNAENTKRWVVEQNKVTSDYLNKIPYRNKVKRRLEQLWNYPRYSSPFKKAGDYYFFKNDGLQNQAVLYRQKPGEKPQEFLNPNTLNNRGVAALGGYSFSKSGKYFAYSIAVAGSDWQEVYVMEKDSKKKLADKIEWVKFSNFSWNGDDGFYYSAFSKPDEKEKLSGKNEYHKVYYHKLGTKQSDDQLIYEDRQHPLRYHVASLTDDGRFLILYVYEGTSGCELWYRDMKDPSQKNFKPLISGFATEPSVIDNEGDKLLVRTNDGAPGYKVVLVDPKKPAKANWTVLIAEKPEVLESVSTGGGYLFCQYLKDASTRLTQHSYDGAMVQQIPLPGIGTATVFNGERAEKEVFFSFTSFSTPASIYKYDAETMKPALFFSTSTRLQTDEFVTDQTFFQSKDGTQIPIFLTYKKGIQRDGNNPVLIYGYGGFNVSITPAFSVSYGFFIEQGGIVAVVNLRGGGEYGEEWHKAGMLDKKQNVFDDFIGAAEFLVAKKYTKPEKIAIQGASNGGLLVGAAMTQRPDLFKVALPAVGVMDMLRFHKFTIGWGWTVEYGNPDSADHFKYLHKYSPYHNLRAGTSYPATLITTADHDDRVVPAHSFKFAARLQELNEGPNPMLIRIDTDAGHGAGKPTSKQIEEATDIWCFVMENLGMGYPDSAPQPKPERPAQDGSGKNETGTDTKQQKQDKDSRKTPGARKG